MASTWPSTQAGLIGGMDSRRNNHVELVHPCPCHALSGTPYPHMRLSCVELRPGAVLENAITTLYGAGEKLNTELWSGKL